MKDKIVNICKKFKNFFTTHTKMKLLVAYLVANLLYILIGSYIVMTKQINPQFDYKQFSFGLRNMLILNVIVFLIICLKKRYKKNWVHLGIVAIGIVRSNFNMVCI